MRRWPFSIAPATPKALALLQRLFASTKALDEPRLLSAGWDRYARQWHPAHCEVLPGGQVQFLGDEWTLEDPDQVGSSYGLSADTIQRFDEYLSRELLDRYLPAHAEQGLEIGPGGGRVTELLIPRTDVLHLTDAADAMLKRLRLRFGSEQNLRFYHSDGMTLPPLPNASLDYAIAFDVFVHFEPRLVFWYLQQIATLLKPGGIGIIHYANLLTEGGWRLFERHLQSNVKQRTAFAAFGTMCPELMTRFLTALGLDIVSSDIELIPRDAVAVFRKI